jgi:HTH-type transcriptional regulator/antitoxin HigA
MKRSTIRWTHRIRRGHQIPHGAAGLTRRDLEEIIGTRTRIARVLNQRGLSIAMIRRLHERLGISADVLIRPSRKSAA